MLKIIFGIVFGFSLSAQAQEVTTSFRDFSGGLNDRVATVALPVNESPDLLNVMIDEPSGALTTRKGIVKCGNTPTGAVATGIYEYVRNNGNRSLIISDNSNVWATGDCVVFSTIATGLNAQAVPFFDTFRDKLWIVNKSTWVITWNGTTTSYLDGTGTKPAPPKGQYITHWKERSWIARDANPSAIYFSALTNSVGVAIDPSVSSQAWPATNAFYIAQDDGSPIYAIKVFKDNLFVFKETGIWRIIFESTLNTQIVKSVSNVGCKLQDSIVEIDNLLYFTGNDGIYKFDGNNVVRVSDKIHNTFSSLKQPLRADKFKTWETGLDFNNGINTGTSNTDDYGVVGLLIATTSVINNPTSWDILFGTAVISGSNVVSKTTYTVTRISNSFNATTPVYNTRNLTKSSDMKLPAVGVTSIYMLSGGTSSAASNNIVFSINPNNNISVSEDGITKFSGTHSIGTSTHNYRITFSSRTASFYIDDTFKCSYITNKSSFNAILYFINSAETSINNEQLYFSTFTPTGIFTSEISTFTSLTAYGTFDIGETLNGQTINYYTRTGTSTADVLSSAWVSRTAGDTISSSTNTHFQWKAELATSDTSKTPLVDNVTANYQEGDVASNRLYAVNHNNRVWISGSTAPANSFNDTILVKTKFPLDNWTKFDLRIAAMSKWNNNLYGTSATDGNIYRLDYGSNDNGSAINSYWTWKDEHFNSLSYKKTLTELYNYFVTGNGLNSKFQYSRDGGTNWNTLNLDMSGSMAFGTKRLLFNGGNANAFRFRIYNSTLDESFNYLGFDAFANMYKIRE